MRNNLRDPFLVLDDDDVIDSMMNVKDNTFNMIRVVAWFGSLCGLFERFALL